MRVYLLGAGASVHAGYPLTAQLGERLLAWAEGDATEGPKHLGDLRKLQSAYDDLGDFERILGELRKDLDEGRRKTILNATEAVTWYFNSLRSQPAKLYDELAQRHVCPGDVILTFNYDMAIERSLRLAGLWEIFDGYGRAMDFRSPNAPTSAVKVFKLHGSTNWWGALFGGSVGFSTAQDSLGARPIIFFEGDFDYLGYEGVRDPKAPTSSALEKAGSMILGEGKRFYVETSFGRERESFWRELWSEAEATLGNACEVVIIGYSLPPADGHVRDLLIKAINPAAQVTVYSKSKSADVANELKGRCRWVVVPTDPTFEGFLAAEVEGRAPTGSGLASNSARAGHERPR